MPSSPFSFLVEVDRLKTILRQSPLAAADRRENEAEHSWHMVMMVVILAEHSDHPIDVGYTIQLVLLHALREFESFSNEHTPHPGIANARPLHPLLAAINAPRQIARFDLCGRERLGGILHAYEHAA
ncbi:HD domain-containing protein [Streptomyces sp. TE5632]